MREEQEEVLQSIRRRNEEAPAKDREPPTKKLSALLVDGPSGKCLDASAPTEVRTTNDLPESLGQSVATVTSVEKANRCDAKQLSDIC